MVYNKSMKKKQMVAVILSLLLLTGGVIWYLISLRNSNKTTTIPENVTPGSVQTPQGTPTTPTAVKLYYPMTDFDGRIAFRTFGQLVKRSDAVTPCGAAFSGYHDADDLEVTAAEVSTEVPVYAISSGVVREVGPVSGYGGLLVLGTTVNGQDYTVYYGHISLGSTALVAGESVKAGQKLASLGAQCSTQTDRERKHLHFAIHKGPNVDVRGYVPNLSELSAWIDPRAFLLQNSATKIK